MFDLIRDLSEAYGGLNLLGLTISAAAALACLPALFSRRGKSYRALVGIGLLTAVAAMGSNLAAMRFLYAGKWLPDPPAQVGNWTTTVSEMAPGVLQILGNPKANQAEYVNPFGEVVYYTAVAAGPFENYHDPTICVAGNGFALTAKREFTLPVDGGGPRIRAMIFRRDDVRILMYYWTQTRAGATATEARMGAYKDIVARYQTGYGAVVRGDQTVIIRNYTVLMPDDPLGVQAQRNLDEVCRETYRTLRASARKEAGI